MEIKQKLLRREMLERQSVKVIDDQKFRKMMHLKSI